MKEQILESLHVDGGWSATLFLVDLAIVYYVIYRVFLLIKGTRAAQILVGLVLILLLYFLSGSVILLPTTHWVVDTFVSNLLLIAVIVFQADIRRALAEFGSTTLFSQSRTIEETQVLEEVIRASAMLSSRKIGALIVIERHADLSHFTEEGIRIDSVVTKDVLFSIFLPEHQNPLHDGAVIIRNGRVAAAGCFLPLTNNPKVEKSLGTRHRAAIGLSEDTDAAIVIVSEETGIISIAYREELYRELDNNRMREILQGIFSRQDLETKQKLLERFKRSDDDKEEGG